MVFISFAFRSPWISCTDKPQSTLIQHALSFKTSTHHRLPRNQMSNEAHKLHQTASQDSYPLIIPRRRLEMGDIDAHARLPIHDPDSIMQKGATAKLRFVSKGMLTCRTSANQPQSPTSSTSLILAPREDPDVIAPAPPFPTPHRRERAAAASHPTSSPDFPSMT